MTVTVLTVDTAAKIAFIDEDYLTKDMRRNIEPCPDVFLRSVTNHQIHLHGMNKIYLRIKATIIPFYFGVITSLPPKILIGTSFISKYVESISPQYRAIRFIDSTETPIISNGPDNVLAIHQPRPLTPYNETEDAIPLRVARQTSIEPMSQKRTRVHTKAIG